MPKLPESIGKYKILERLGRGGMSVVYKAQHPTLDTVVVLKKLMLRGESSYRERFRREATLMMKLRHPNVVGVFDHFKEGSGHFLVMEYIDGRPLSELLAREGSFTPAESAWLVGRIAAALSHIHSEGIVHRDVKPSNVLLGTDGSVKLGDFGIAFSPQGSEDITAQGTALGTPSFMSPEQLEDARTADARSDMWSLGVCFFEFLTGRKFVTGPTPAAIREALPGAVRQMPARLPASLPYRYKRFLIRSLRLRPDARLRDGTAGLRLLGTAAKAANPPEELRKRMDALFVSGKILDPTPKAAKPPEGIREAEKRRRPQIPGLKLRRASLSPGVSNRVKNTVNSKVSSKKPASDARRRPLSRRPWFLAVIIAAAGFSLLLLIPGAWDILLRSNSYGMLRLELEYARETPDYWLSAVEARLYREEAGILQSVISPVLRRSGDSPARLFSRRISLPAGAYRLQWNLGDKVTWHSFNLAPIRNQRASGIKEKVLKEELGPPPVFELDFSWSAADAVTGNDISSTAQLNFERVDAPGTALESGASYRFQISAPGFRSSTFAVPVGPWRRELHLSASLWPQPARLVIENTTDKSLTPRLNGSTRYLDTSKDPGVERIGRLPPGEIAIFSLLPGDYDLKPGFGRMPSRELHLSSGSELRLKIIHSTENGVSTVLTDN